jgi:putative membrane protein
MRVSSVVLGFVFAGFVSLPAEAQPRALDDAGIVAIFDLANTADIETGQLAMQRGHSKEVRDFGRMLVDAHTAVRQNGRDLAKKLGVIPALPAGDQSAEQHASVMQRLRSLSGVEFDRAFTQHELDFHTAVLSAVKGTLLPAIQNRELKDFVTSLAPAFEAHRLGAQNLRNKLGS